MRVLITGHKGYIGSKIYKKCLELGYEVAGLDLKEGKDILHIDSYKEYVEFRPEIIFHLAANPRIQYSVENPSLASQNNVLGTAKVLEFAKNNNVKRVVFSSSSSIHGNFGFPVSPYGLHKLQSELECRLYSEFYSLDTVCLRYFNVYSEDQIPTDTYPTVISAWMEAIRKNNNLLVNGDGRHIRDYIHVDDVVECNIFAANYSDRFNGKCFDVGFGKNYSLNYIKNLILKYHDITFVHGPEKKSDPLCSLANVDDLKKIGWCANIDFETGLERCFNKKGK
jgi:nucleoside-diphosphate-sugar epimerase